MTRGTGPSVVVAVRLKTTTAQALDRLRGGMSRSAWIRTVIEREASKK